MRVLITGGTGFAGCHAAARLAAGGHSVRLLVRDPRRIARALGPLGIDEIDHIVGDVTDEAAIERAMPGCDAVLHSAALFTLDRRQAAEVQRTNVRGAEIVLGAAANRGLDPILYVSSISALFPAEGERITPDESVKNPVDMYARSKADAERVSRGLQTSGAPITTFYPGAVWGPDDPTIGDGVRAMLNYLKLGVVPTTSGGLPLTDVRDLAEMFVAALEPGRGPRRYMASEHFLSVADMVASWMRVTGRRLLSPTVPGAWMRGYGRLVDAVQHRTGVVIGPSYEGMLTLTRGVPPDYTRTRAELGVEPRPPDDTFRDSFRSLHARGALDARAVGKLADA